MTRPVKTRFAPSPTGALHIGGARTALFNMLYAHHKNGEYVVRIEDTDVKRSTEENVNIIKESLNWLGLAPDSEYIFQSKNIEAHKAAVQAMLKNGHAYECFTTPEELNTMREEAKAKGLAPKYDGRHRELTAEQKAEYRAEGRTPTVRIKIPYEGTTCWDDAVQGHIVYENSELDDFIIARSDGSPTYNLAVVVDDINAEITHVIRGDDHINNTPKQIHIYKALGAILPTFAHVPLIHGGDGRKMSKRHGATSVEEYKTAGYISAALINFLMRLGWAFKDEEIMTLNRAIELFDIHDVNKGASIFDTKKLEWMNSQYIKQMTAEELIKLLEPFFMAKGLTLNDTSRQWLMKGMEDLKPRAKKLDDLANAASFYLKTTPLTFDEKASKALDEHKTNLSGFVEVLENTVWEVEQLDTAIKAYVTDNGYKFPHVGMPLRAALTGTTNAPSVGGILYALGKDESLARIKTIF